MKKRHLIWTLKDKLILEINIFQVEQSAQQKVRINEAH